MFTVYRLLGPDGPYTGFTSRGLKARFAQHIDHAKSGTGCPLVTKSMRKHGFDKFRIEPVGTAATKQQARELEAKATLFFNSLYPHGLNLLIGSRHTPVTRAKFAGERHGRSKLTSHDVLMIRQLYATGGIPSRS